MPPKILSEKHEALRQDVNAKINKFELRINRKVDDHMQLRDMVSFLYFTLPSINIQAPLLSSYIRVHRY